VLTCFDNYIGLRGVCESTPPTSNTFIDDVPGISLESLASTADGSNVRGTELFERQYALSVSELQSDLISALSEHVNFNGVIALASAGFFTSTYQPAAALSRGVSLTRKNQSAIQSMRIDSAEILASTAGNYTLQVIDGVLTTNYPFTVATGGLPVTVQLNYTAVTEAVKVVFDQTNTAVNLGKTLSCHTNCGSFDSDFRSYYECYQRTGLRIRGWNGSNEDGFTYGVSVTASVVCSYDRLICAMRSNLKTMLFYRLGENLLNAILSSSRMNDYTRDGMVEKLEFQRKRCASLYLEHKKQVAETLKMSLRNFNDPNCMGCKGLTVQSIY